MAQMQIILSRSILRLLRRSNIATTSPASVPHLVSTSRPLLSFMASGTAPSALARGVSPSFAAANQPSSCVSKFSLGSRNMASSSGVKGEELGKPDRGPLNPSAKEITNSLEDDRRARVNMISGKEDTCSRTTMDVMGTKPDTTRENVHIAGCELSTDPTDDVPPMEELLPDSSHRDGSIYSGTPSWKTYFCIADRNETRFEATTFSDPVGCGSFNGTCRLHPYRHMFQIFSLKVADIPVERGPVELYGYIAARDNVDRLLNYVINFSRDDPIIVEQGSLIDMAGPKRGIKLVDTTLIEFDMRIKTGGDEKEDLQLIDGVTVFDDIYTWGLPFTCRIHGDFGAVDMTAARVSTAVQAIVEVAISQVQGHFSMRLGCFTSGLHEEIRLFDGAIAQSLCLKRSVVAVAKDNQIDLKFKVAADSCIPAVHCCSFAATKHGRATQEIQTDFALMSVKVTWSTLL